MKYRSKHMVDAVQITDEWFDGPHPNPLHNIGDRRVITHPKTRSITIKDAWDVSVGIGDWLVRDGKRIDGYDSYEFLEKFEPEGGSTKPLLTNRNCPFCGSSDIQSYERFVISDKDNLPVIMNRCNHCGSEATQDWWRTRTGNFVRNNALESAAVLARTGEFAPKELAQQIRALKTNAQDPMDKNISNHPQKCPVTGRDFFLVMNHPTLGDVATYGGPYDSYTIPEWDGEEFRSERYDHDEGCWVEGGEPYPFILISEDKLIRIEDDETC